MAQAKLSIVEAVSGGAVILSFDGEVDAHTSAQMKDAVDKSIAAGKVKIVFDFSKLSYISSAGIGILNASLNAIKAKGGKMSIAGPNQTVWDTLDVMYFTKKVPVQKDLASAVKEVAG